MSRNGIIITMALLVYAIFFAVIGISFNMADIRILAAIFGGVGVFSGVTTYMAKG